MDISLKKMYFHNTHETANKPEMINCELSQWLTKH